MSSERRIKTRLLIISDTHGAKPTPEMNGVNGSNGSNGSSELAGVGLDGSAESQHIYGLLNYAEGNSSNVRGYREPLPEADVVLHCGDLTKMSRVHEYEDTFEMLRKCRAPLKLAIAGNHDLALDEAYWRRHMDWYGMPDLDTPRRVQQIVEDARAHGVQYLEEGTHTFDLENGARLKIFASPWTPEYGMWAFQYERGHDFQIPQGIDVVMTHGPPENILDLAGGAFGYSVHAGCSNLLLSTSHAKPRIHCFGHIHEAWGAELTTWRGMDASNVYHGGNIRTIANLDMVAPPTDDDDEETVQRRNRLREGYTRDRAVCLNIAEGDNRVEPGRQTLFLNAAIMSIRYQPVQFPWLIDIDLPAASSPPIAGQSSAPSAT